MIKIDKGIPMPQISKKMPYKDMEVGDSFFVPGMTAKKVGSNLAYAKEKTGFQFTSRTVDGGVRVWRIK